MAASFENPRFAGKTDTTQSASSDAGDGDIEETWRTSTSTSEKPSTSDGGRRVAPESHQTRVDRSESSVGAAFADFFRERDAVKKTLYRRVIFVGWFFIGVGCFLGIPGLGVWYTSVQGTKNFVLGILFALLGTFLFVCGLCIISTVPPDEFDIDVNLETSWPARYFAQLLLAVVTIILGCLVACFLPYFMGILLILSGIWILLHQNPSPPRSASDKASSPVQSCVANVLERKFTTKITIIAMLVFPAVWIIYLNLAFAPRILSSYNLLGNLWSEWTQHLQDIWQIAMPLYAVGALIIMSGNGIALWNWRRLAIRDELGWRTQAFYGVLYSWLISGGVFFIMINTVSTYINVIQNQDSVLPGIFTGLIVLTPNLVVVLAGRKRCFNWLARYFEYDIKRLQEDGALMAELAASCQALDTQTRVRWVWRQKNQPDFAPAENRNKNFIKRQFWLKAELLSDEYQEAVPEAVEVAKKKETASNEMRSTKAATTLTLKIFCAEDAGMNWHAYYVGRSIRMNGGSSQAYSSAFFDRLVSTSVKESEIVERNQSAGYVVIRTKIMHDQTTREDLLHWATSNMRRFNFKNFTDDLLLKSPRELGDDAERERIYALSEPVTIKRHADKIDFFISHSWDDDAKVKCALLRRFSETFQKAHRGKHPTYWFDKCCIDQRAPGNALAVLPINIGACHKFLILMSESYLRRLWCVWELFTLFTFCNKELALDRIELLPLVDESSDFDVVAELESFDIDNAHCFDPNEEFKLRNIMHDVGIDRLKSSIQHMAKLYKRRQGESQSLSMRKGMEKGHV